MNAMILNVVTKQMLKAALTGLVLIFFCVNAQAAKPVKDSSLGLSKTSVNDSPEPEKFGYSNNFPGTGNLLPRAYLNAPPQIPHNIEAFLPVTAKSNNCKMCHDNRAMRGKKVKGQATAIPDSHYTDLRHAPGKVTTELIGARYVCTQCHVPQANVKPLVDNTFDD